MEMEIGILVLLEMIVTGLVCAAVAAVAAFVLRQRTFEEAVAAESCRTTKTGNRPPQASGHTTKKYDELADYHLSDLGPVAPISVNFNHQLAYFADQSHTTHVPHQPTAVV